MNIVVGFRKAYGFVKSKPTNDSASPNGCERRYDFDRGFCQTTYDKRPRYRFSQPTNDRRYNKGGIMSNIVERILKDIEKGKLEVEGIDEYRATHVLNLPHFPYLATDEVTIFSEQYDSPVCLG
jgi:hypothetical protein